MLKCNTGSFNDIIAGLKTFEVRKNDRNYHIGDWLYLREWNEDTSYTFRSVKCHVKYLFYGGRYGIEDGYVILGIDDIRVFYG